MIWKLGLRALERLLVLLKSDIDMPAPRHYDETVQVTSKTTFISTKKHRIRGNPNASIWTIGYREEYIVFLKSKPHLSNDGISWGVHTPNGRMAKLGDSNCGNYDLIFAKYTSHENNDDLWHGYPANYIKNTQDVPSNNFLKDLVLKNYLTKAKRKKIRNGKEI